MRRVCSFCERWESGGIESFLCNVLTRMDMTDLEVDIVASSIGESVFTNPLRQHGVRFFELSDNQRNIPENHGRFRKLVRERKYDVLHLNAFHGLSLAYLKIAEQEGVPVRIAHSHNTALRKSATRPVKQLIHAWARNRYTRYATDLWACSKNAAEFLFGKREFQKRGYIFIPNGIDVERFRFNPVIREQVRAELGISDKFIIGHIGRLCYQKNQTFLLNVLAEAVKRDPSAVLLLVGDGEDKPALIKKAASMGISDKVIFYGTTKHPERLLWAMDVFAFPSVFEGFGIAVIEALSAGLAVVCSENVPEEVRTLRYINSLPLRQGPLVWAETLLTGHRRDTSTEEVRHPFFLATLIYLPILIIGLEQVIQKKKTYLLIAVVFVAVISYVYFACMLAVLAAIYVIIRFFDIYKEKRFYEFSRMLGRLFIAAGIGVALGSPILIPTLRNLLSTGRIGNDISIPAAYSASRYHRMVAFFIVSPDAAGSWTFLGFSVLTIPALIALFVRKDKAERSLRTSFLALTIMLLIPAVAYVMSGFNAISNRWCFAYAFCCSAILMFEMPAFPKLEKNQLIFVWIGTALYIAVCVFVINKTYDTTSQCVMVAIAVLILTLCCIAENRVKSFSAFVALGITCFSIWYSGFLFWDPQQLNTVSAYTDKGTAYDNYFKSEYASFAKSIPSQEDKDFYRVSGNMISRNSMNFSFYDDINGLSGFANSFYPAYIDWITELEQTRDRNNIDYGPIDRTPMLTLSGVKYYVVRQNGKEIIPYGFEVVDRIKNNKNTDLILENKYALPVGYTYDNYIPYEDYMALNALEKQEVQLQAVVLRDELSNAKIEKGTVYNTTSQIPYQISDMQKVSWDNGILNVKEAGATITLTFEGSPESETYLRVVNLDLTSGTSTRQWILGISTEQTEATDGRFSADGYLYSSGQKTQLFDLGYSEDGFKTITITFPAKGTCRLDDLQVWCHPMESYTKYVNALREEVLENVETNWRGLTGTISVSKDKILCLAIPYDEGWSAYVDGKKVELFQANTAFMAVELEKGSHKVEIRYWYPGLTTGLILAAAGIGAVVGIAIYYEKEKLGRWKKVTLEKHQRDQ